MRADASPPVTQEILCASISRRGHRRPEQRARAEKQVSSMARAVIYARALSSMRCPTRGEDVIYERNVIYGARIMHVRPSFETPSLREGPQDEGRDC